MFFWLKKAGPFTCYLLRPNCPMAETATKRPYRKYQTYREYVENVVKKCSHQWLILNSKTFKYYRINKESNPNLILPPGKHIKIVPARCKSYSCPICGRHKVFELMERLKGLPLERYRFFTLTLKNSYTLESTENNIKRVSECFAKLNRTLRKRPEFKNLEYFRVIEDGKRGMVHIHGIWNKYIPTAELSKLWLNITGDSYRVDLQRVKNRSGCVNYLYKYLTKNVSEFNDVENPTFFNLDKNNTAALFYENGKRRWCSSRNFFNKSVKRVNDWVPFYCTKETSEGIETLLIYLVKTYKLTRNNFDFEQYHESDLFLYHLFKPPE